MCSIIIDIVERLHAASAVLIGDSVSDLFGVDNVDYRPAGQNVQASLDGCLIIQLSDFKFETSLLV